MKLMAMDIKSIFKQYGAKFFRNAFLIGFVLFLLNLFLGFSLHLKQLGNNIQEKLGVYLYLDDKTFDESDFYDKLIGLKQSLEDNNIEVNFVSSEDAFDFLEQKLPGITDNFQKFGIDNPLSSTLYLRFTDKKDYEYIKSFVSENKDIILNYKDIESGTSLASQDNKVMSVINFMNFMEWLIYIVIAFLFLLVLAIVHYFLEVIFEHFHNDLHRKKLMGASEWQIIGALLHTTIVLLLIAILIGIVFTFALDLSLSIYVKNLFSTNIFEYFLNYKFWIYVAIESAVILVFSVVFAYRYLHRLDEKL